MGGSLSGVLGGSRQGQWAAGGRFVSFCCVALGPGGGCGGCGWRVPGATRSRRTAASRTHSEPSLGCP
eukprot:2396032-Prymnesium_polylepis.1